MTVSVARPKRKAPRFNNAHTPEEQARFAHLWRTGVKAKVIGAEFGIGVDGVKRWRRRMGLPARLPNPMRPRKNRLPDGKIAKAVELWRSRRFDTVEIAELLGVSEAAVANSLSDVREARA